MWGKDRRRLARGIKKGESGKTNMFEDIEKEDKTVFHYLSTLQTPKNNK